MERKGHFVVPLLLLLALSTALTTLETKAENEKGEGWVLVEYGPNYIKYTNGTAFRMVIGRPNVYDPRAGKWAPLIFENHSDEGYYLVRTGLVACKIFEDRAEYYDPNMTSLLAVERWSVWMPGFKATSFAFEDWILTVNEDEVNITREMWCSQGKLEIKHTFRPWQGAKQAVSFINYLQGGRHFIVKEIDFSNDVSEFPIFENETGLFKIKALKPKPNKLPKVKRIVFSSLNRRLKVMEDYRDCLDRIGNITFSQASKKMTVVFGPFNAKEDQPFTLDPTTITLSPPTDDAYCDGANPDTNYGSSTDLYAGDYTNPYNTTIRFDVSSIPNDATITQALLCLYSHGRNYWTAGIDFLEIHRITSSWDESTITYNTFPSYSDPVYRKLNATTGWNTWDIKEIVQGWVNGSYANYGVYIGRDFTNSGDGSGWHIFYSKESGYTEFHPQLNVTYTTNIPPSKPSLASPSPNGTIISVVNPWLNCTFTDPNGDAMNLSFYWSNDTLIGTLTNVANGTTTGIQATVSRGQTYYWYVNVSDGEGTTQSDLFSFYVNYLPTISFSRATPFSVRRAEVVGLEFAASDNETATENLTVTIQIKDLTGTIVSSGTASYDSTYDVFIYAWTVPQEAQLGYYTAIGTVQDGDGGTATTTKEQAFEVIGPGGAPAGGPGGSSSRTQSVTTPAPTETPTPPFSEEREEFEALLYEYRYLIGVILLALVLGFGGKSK